MLLRRGQCVTGVRTVYYLEEDSALLRGGWCITEEKQCITEESAVCY